MKTKLLLAPLCVAALFAETPSAIALRNARVVTGTGATLSKGTVLLRNGLIEAVGESVAIPADAWVIEAEGLTVYPGLIDALSTWGLPEAPAAPPSGFTGRRSVTPTRAPRPTPTPSPAPATPPARGPEDRPSNTSWQRAADLVDPAERRLEEARSSGFTTAVSFPTSGIFAGQGAVLDLAGNKRGMVVESPVGQYLSIPSRGSFGSFPGSLMGVLAYIRQIYLDAEHYKLVKAAYEQHPVGMKRPDYDRALEGVLDSPRALLPAERAYELERMARFAAELKLHAVLYGAHEAYRDAAILKQFAVPVLVSLKWPERARDADPDEEESLRTLELRARAPSTPAELAKAGVPFAFYSDGTAPREMLRAVKRAVDAGLAPADALRALTLAAAQIYGVSDRLGSIEKGKIANLVVTKGDLFQDKPEIRHVFIDGVKFEPVPEAAPPPGGRPARPTGGER